MPLAAEEICWDHACGIGPDGHWFGWFRVRVEAAALWRLGLHPDQPAARVTGPSPPAWWHAEAERRARHRPGRTL
ncbi:hypothetical protein [Streptomyces cucumeris]|uniref:hypothetical protein n=1 Tax=Streptomyces cucumeris TaxID=2962890 RepID=UPI0020C83C53|nr:hypothetical protein [Streptomyces sp. NEAU-Y11]MCP9210881.1 hypothetical protein [Streptomyces sp. NEAU-Y11]